MSDKSIEKSQKQYSSSSFDDNQSSVDLKSKSSLNQKSKFSSSEDSNSSNISSISEKSSEKLKNESKQNWGTEKDLN